MKLSIEEKLTRMDSKINNLVNDIKYIRDKEKRNLENKRIRLKNSMPTLYIIK